MASVYDSNDYKVFLKTWIAERPKGGRGESRRMAERLSLSTTMISQILNGDKHFTMEAASDLLDHLSLTERDGDHLLLLIEFARAGSENLRVRLRRRIENSRETARKLSERMETDRNLTSAESATYYSNWTYTGITNLLATDAQTTPELIATRLKVPRELVVKVLSFLLESGIVIQKDGQFEIGVKRTHLGAHSPLVIKHHQNWRLQGFNQMIQGNKNNLFYTAPMSLSVEVAEKIRDDLPTYLEKIVKWIGPSKSEVVRCLNIDFFEY